MHRDCGGTRVLGSGTQRLWRCHTGAWKEGTWLGGGVQGAGMVAEGLERCLSGKSTNCLSMRAEAWVG